MRNYKGKSRESRGIERNIENKEAKYQEICLEYQRNLEDLQGIIDEFKRSLEENESKFKDLCIENQRNIDLLREKQENLEFLNKSLDENKANQELSVENHEI